MSLGVLASVVVLAVQAVLPFVLVAVALLGVGSVQGDEVGGLFFLFWSVWFAVPGVLCGAVAYRLYRGARRGVGAALIAHAVVGGVPALIIIALLGEGRGAPVITGFGVIAIVLTLANLGAGALLLMDWARGRVRGS